MTRAATVGLALALLLAATGCERAVPAWSSLDWSGRWCHLKYRLAGEPIQLGDGRCESLL